MGSLQRRSIMKSRTCRTWLAASCAKSWRTSARSVSATPFAEPDDVVRSIDAKPASRSSELKSRSKVSAIEA